MHNSNSFTGEYEKDFQLLVKAFDAAGNGIIITDHRQPDDPIIYSNAAFEKMSGYTHDEIIGHNCRFLQGNDRQQHERKLLKTAIEKGEYVCVQLRNYTKAGVLFWNELTLSPVKDNNGEVTHYIGIQNDITARKNAEFALQHEKQLLETRIKERTAEVEENRRFLASIVETVRESLLVLDEKMKVLSANEYFYNTFKVSRHETTGKRLYELGNGQWDIPALRELLETILPSKNPVEGFEVEHDFPHIGKKLMILNAHQVKLQGSLLNRILLAIEDVTDRRSMEIRKDDFISIASHELKTPLTSVKAYIQILEHLTPPEAGENFKEILSKANSSVSKLNNLVEDLLDVSKIQSGKMKFNYTSFNIGSMLSETIAHFKHIAPSHSIKITGNLEHEIYGDRDRIEQVVINLLTNAIKYSPNNDVITVSVARLSNYVKVAITDYGLGIDQSDHKKVFQRFFRVEGVQKKFPGIGVGLYVCEQIISNHKGTLWVESEIGSGSTFSFTLPVNKLNK